MNLSFTHTAGVLACLALGILVAPLRSAETDASALSAKDLAAKLASRDEGTAYVRLRLEVKQPSGVAKQTLQIQIKERRTRGSADVLYQVLWPKERKGESVLLHKGAGRPPSGTLFSMTDKTRPLAAAQMGEPLFGSDLSYDDAIEDFYEWDSQAIVASEAVNGVTCTVIESRPGKGDHSTYASVRSWVDTRRMLPVRVEKYAPAGKLVRRIDTTRVAADDTGHPVPANLAVRGSAGDSVTELDGSRIKHGVVYADRDFSAEALAEVSAPRSGGDN